APVGPYQATAVPPASRDEASRRTPVESAPSSGPPYDRGSGPASGERRHRRDAPRHGARERSLRSTAAERNGSRAGKRRQLPADAAATPGRKRVHNRKCDTDRRRAPASTDETPLHGGRAAVTTAHR